MSAEKVIEEALNALPADARPAALVNRQRAAVAINALKAAGFLVFNVEDFKQNRVAVVELPKPNQYDEWVADERGASGPWIVWMSLRDIQVRTSGYCDAARARAFAAALLAAADVAEARS
jgi:hypothetical protein